MWWFAAVCVCVCVRACVCVCVRVCVSNRRFIQFALGSCYAEHKRIVNESVHRKEQHTSGINTIP